MHHVKCLTTIVGLILASVINIFMLLPREFAATGERPPRGFCGHIELMAQSDPICLNYMASNADGSTDNLLVYYRLQTVGDRLDNLETLTINQLLSQSLKRKLFLPKQSTASAKNQSNNNNDQKNVWAEKRPLVHHANGDDMILGNGGATSRPTSAQQHWTSFNDHHSTIATSSDKIQQFSNNKHVEALNVYLHEHSYCAEAIMIYLCRFLYPNCHYNAKKHDSLPLVRPTCRQDCILLRDTYCAQVPWSVVIAGLLEALNSTLHERVLPIDILAEANDVIEQEEKVQQEQTRPTIPSSESNHYYWPHEKSFLECDSLPLSTGGGYNYITTSVDTKTSSNQANGAKMAKRRRSWPICSDAQLANGISIRLSSHNLSTSSIGTQHHTINDATTNISSSSSGESEAQAKIKYNDDKMTPGLVLGVTQFEECRRGRGGSYTGQVSLTRSGKPCQSWRSQWPHQHNSESELMFSEMTRVDAGNFCRNPGSLELLPWCYTRDPLTRWEYCDIQECN